MKVSLFIDFCLKEIKYISDNVKNIYDRSIDIDCVFQILVTPRKEEAEAEAKEESKWSNLSGKFLGNIKVLAGMSIRRLPKSL